MSMYKVSWIVNIDTDSPEKAAQIAQNIIKEMTTNANVFRLMKCTDEYEVCTIQNPDGTIDSRKTITEIDPIHTSFGLHSDR